MAALGNYLWLSMLWFVFGIWSLVKIWPSNKLLAIATFLFPPIGIFPMLSNWGTDDDVRLPVLGSLILWGASTYFMFQTSAQYAGMSEAQIEAQLMQEFGASEQDILAAQNMSSETGTKDTEIEEDLDLRWRIGVSKLTLQTGTVDFPEAHATLEVPDHFRFVAGQAWEGLLSSVGEPSQGGRERLLGWMVHNRANFSSDDPLAIEIIWLPDGHVDLSRANALSEGEIAAAQTAAAAEWNEEWEFAEGPIRFERFLAPPTFDETRHMLGYAEWMAYGNNHAELSCTMLKFAREGVLVFNAYGMPKRRQELCMRSVRLAANSTEIAEKYRYDKYWSWIDKESSTSLATYIAEY